MIVAVGSNCAAGCWPKIARGARRKPMRVAGQADFPGGKPRDDTYECMKPRRRGGRGCDLTGVARKRFPFSGGVSAAGRELRCSAGERDMTRSAELLRNGNPVAAALAAISFSGRRLRRSSCSERIQCRHSGRDRTETDAPWLPATVDIEAGLPGAHV